MELKDNQMQRGINQALYKYLPESWANFFIKKTRTSYTVFVKNWDSRELTGVNNRRLLAKI